EGAVQTKLDAFEAYGATVHRCAPTIAAREAMCEQVRQDTGGTAVHPYADSPVIAGQGAAAPDLSRAQPLDALVVPVGGGGLASGTAIALAAVSPATKLFLAEPAGAAETLQSLRDGTHVTDFIPDTICDGLRGTLGAPNFEILREHA